MFWVSAELFECESSSLRVVVAFELCDSSCEAGEFGVARC